MSTEQFRPFMGRTQRRCFRPRSGLHLFTGEGVCQTGEEHKAQYGQQVLVGQLQAVPREEEEHNAKARSGVSEPCFR